MNGKIARLIRKACNVNEVNNHSEDVRKHYQQTKDKWKSTPRNERPLFKKELVDSIA